MAGLGSEQGLSVTELPDNYEELTSVEKIEVNFPALKGGKGYEDKSQPTIDYNCLAWALGINWTRYDPEPRCAGYYWLPGIEREWSLKAIRKIIERHDYLQCAEPNLEEGYEKVVFYVDEAGVPQHFARQLPTGKWTSKMGDLNDIEHDTLEALSTPDYGAPTLVFKRKIQTGAAVEAI